MIGRAAAVVATGMIAACEQPDTLPTAAESPAEAFCMSGMLTDEGVECPAFRGDDGSLYTLVGALDGLATGDRVCVCGTLPEISYCMQGVTISVSWIGTDCPD